MAGHTTLAAASWYRFVLPAGTRMPTEPPRRAGSTLLGDVCGTNAAAYLSTPHPNVGDGPVVGTVKFAYSFSSDYLSGSREIRVCACSYDGVTTTYTYKLPGAASRRVAAAASLTRMRTHVRILACTRTRPPGSTSRRGAAYMYNLHVQLTCTTYMYMYTW